MQGLRQLGMLIILTVFCSRLTAQSPKGLEVNQRAPLFAATDQHGRQIKLDSMLKHGPVVLVFYRGQWCPYCNRQLKQLEDSLSFILSRGAALLAITPEKPESINKTISKTSASYPILFDEGLSIMKAYDVAFRVEDKTIRQYLRHGIDLQANNGSNGNTLPVPAVYVIAKNGKIIYRHFDPDYRKRASVAEIVEHLKK